MSTFSILLDASADGPAETWQPIAKLGDYEDKRYGPFSITADDVEGWQRTLATEQNGEVAIDRDHGAAKGNTRAAGWVREIKLQDDGRVLGRIGWTPEGVADVRAGYYRYVSPEFTSAYKGEDGKVVGKALLGVALTNRPFLRRGMPALQLSDDGQHAEVLELGGPGDNPPSDSTGVGEPMPEPRGDDAEDAEPDALSLTAAFEAIALFRYDASLHPRDSDGKWVSVRVGDVKAGGHVRFPEGGHGRVKRHSAGSQTHIETPPGQRDRVMDSGNHVMVKQGGDGDGPDSEGAGDDDGFKAFVAENTKRGHDPATLTREAFDKAMKGHAEFQRKERDRPRPKQAPPEKTGQHHYRTPIEDGSPADLKMRHDATAQRVKDSLIGNPAKPKDRVRKGKLRTARLDAEAAAMLLAARHADKLPPAVAKMARALEKGGAKPSAALRAALALVRRPGPAQRQWDAAVNRADPPARVIMLAAAAPPAPPEVEPPGPFA